MATAAILTPGRYDIHTIHTSWQLPNIMDMPNFNIYLRRGVCVMAGFIGGESGNTDERYGARAGLNISSDGFPGGANAFPGATGPQRL